MTVKVRVAVQQRERLFREGLGLLLDAEPGLETVGTAVTPDELVELCNEHQPDVAVIEVDAAGRDACRVSSILAKHQRPARLVGLAQTLSPRTAGLVRRAGIRALVPRQMGIVPVVEAVRSEPEEPVLLRFPAAPVSGADELTSREIDVLKLIGTGRTAHQISGKLDISPKTVENHKQRTFRKLGVQNQAHAVAVALRRGLLTPDGVIDLTAEG